MHTTGTGGHFQFLDFIHSYLVCASLTGSQRWRGESWDGPERISRSSSFRNLRRWIAIARCRWWWRRRRYSRKRWSSRWFFVTASRYDPICSKRQARPPACSALYRHWARFILWFAIDDESIVFTANSIRESRISLWT